MSYLGRTGAPCTGLKRAALCAAALVCALAVANANAGEAKAALTWNAAPLAVDPGNALTAVSCPSASLCVASTGAQELAFSPNRFRRPQPHTLFSGRGLQIESLWCATSTLCVAIDFQSAVSFNPTKVASKLTPTRLETVTGEGLVSVRCPSRSECVAIDSFGGAMTFNPVTHKVLKRRISVDGNERLTALACPSVSQCTALDDNGTEYTFQPQTGQRLGSSQIDAAVGLDAPSGASDNELDAISCPTTKLCAAADTLGNIVTFGPQPGGASGAYQTVSVQADPNGSLSAISCKPSGVCAATDRSGNAIGGSAMSNSWQPQAVDTGHVLNSVACPTLSQCIAADSSGSAFRLYPTAV